MGLAVAAVPASIPLSIAAPPGSYAPPARCPMHRSSPCAAPEYCSPSAPKQTEPHSARELHHQRCLSLPALLGSVAFDFAVALVAFEVVAQALLPVALPDYQRCLASKVPAILPCHQPRFVLVSATQANVPVLHGNIQLRCD